jgi:hypothetical protein
VPCWVLWFCHYPIVVLLVLFETIFYALGVPIIFIGCILFAIPVFILFLFAGIWVEIIASCMTAVSLV